MAARDNIGTPINLNMGGTAMIGQLDYEEPNPLPSFLPVGGSITQYSPQVKSGEFVYTFPAAAAAWSDSQPIPNVINLVRYLAAAGNYTEVVGGGTIWQTCENGEVNYNANHSDTWSDFKIRAQSKISWLWGSFIDGGCGVIRVNSTQVKFIGTYGVWNNEAGNDERIACTEYGPFTDSVFGNGCIIGVYHWEQRDAFGDSYEIIAPTASEVRLYQSPFTDIVHYYPNFLIWNEGYGSLNDTLDNSMNDSFGDGIAVHNTMFSLTTVTSPYNSEMPIYTPGHEITVPGYLQTWGSDTTGLGDNQYERGDDTGDKDGNGDYDFDSDDVDGVDEDMFTVDAQSCGFVTVYKPPKSTLQQFGSWLYGTMPTTYGSFLENIKKLQLNPMDGIISLNISHFNAATSGSQDISFYGQASGFSAPVVSKLTHVKRCGSITVNEVIGGWMSYGNNVNLKVYLPYCGTFAISTNEVQGGGKLSLTYTIDVLTGACVAEIKCDRPSRRGITEDDYSAPIYRFTGNVFQQVPISSVDYSGIIQGQLGLAAGVGTVAASAATGNAMGLISGLSSIINSAGSHPTVDRVGNCGSSYGYMSDQVPYLMYEFPAYSMPSKYNNFYGGPIYDIAWSLGDYDGYTEIDPTTIWTDNLDEITQEEEQMLKQILNTGGIYIEHNTDYSNYEP